MRTLKDKVAEMMGAKKLTYTLNDGYVLIMTRDSDGWHMNYYDQTATVKQWEKDVFYRTIDNMIDGIVHCEIKCMEKYIAYLNEFCYEDVDVKIDPEYVWSTVVQKMNIKKKEGEVI